MDILKIIEEKILENGKSATYSRIAIREVTAGKPTVGIWWYLKGRVLKIEELPENLEHLDMICVPQEHSKTFPFVQKQYATEIPELLNVKFNQIERGRVWLMFNITDSTRKGFVITCSTATSRNPVAIQAIKDAFGLTGKTVRVEAQPCMYDREILLK